MNKHGMMDMDPDMIVCRMRMHGKGHGHGMGHGPHHDPELCGRNFFSKEEKIEMMKRYKNWLDKESKGIEEAIEKMEKE